jgi:hypothetical protein
MLSAATLAPALERSAMQVSIPFLQRERDSSLPPVAQNDGYGRNAKKNRQMV